MEGTRYAYETLSENDSNSIRDSERHGVDKTGKEGAGR